MGNIATRIQVGKEMVTEPAVFAQRRERLRQKMRQRNLDAMLVTQAANRFYLSGFELHDAQPNESSGCLVVTADGRDWLATDSRFTEAARRIWDKDRIFIYSSPIGKDLAGLLRKCGAIIGFERAGLSCAFFNSLRKWRAPALIPADGLVEDLRLIKDEAEIAALRRSFALNHNMLAWLHKELAAGAMTGLCEKELAWEIEKYFRQNGAQELAFATIAAFGKNGALPHAIPANDIIEARGPLLVDIGCRVDNYCSDQTRSWWLGNDPDPQFEKALELAQKAQKAALAMMRPGVICADVHAAARKVFEDAGVASAFNHGLGHGVGLQTHEAPSLSPRDKRKLEKGMTVTVEPGLYYPAWGGVRWEHTVLVEEDGVSVF